jgi:hypothetical protein
MVVGFRPLQRAVQESHSGKTIGAEQPKVHCQRHLKTTI